MDIAFFGTSNRSIPILESLKRSDFDLVLCVTKEDVTVGRKKEIKPTAVKTWAQSNRVQVVTIGDTNPLGRRQTTSILKSGNIDLCVVADFSFMIPEEIFTLPKYGFVNIHFSLLPSYRGASPVQFAILNQDKEIGITYLQVVKEMDAGDILFQSKHNLESTETTDTLYNKLFEKAAMELPNVLKEYVEDTLKPQKQDHTKATYTYSPSHTKSTHIFKEDGKIDWNKSPSEIDAMVRAFNPWPIAWTTLGELAEYVGKPLSEGKNTDTTVKIVATKINNNTLEIKSLQVAGKNKIDFASFENGYLLS